jgi:putative membrane protein
VSTDSTSSSPPGEASIDAAAVYRITRPDAKLVVLYFLRALATLPFFPFVFLYYLRIYLTLRFEFTDESVTVSWGRLWHREVYLTYARIQDIHLSRGLFQRWLGLGTIHIQTASGSSKPEMSIEGLLEHEMVRDFLYSRMRGASDGRKPAPRERSAMHDALPVLEEIRDELRSIRGTLEGRSQ